MGCQLEKFALEQNAIAWSRDQAFRDIWRAPLKTTEGRRARMFVKIMALLARRYVLEVKGNLEALDPKNDPFIVALNHSQRHEAVLAPGLLIYMRRGGVIHFLADWAFMLVPFVGMAYRVSKVIPVTRKDAKPKFLNIFRPLFHHPLSAHDRALEKLRGGSSVGVFPEGTINRHPTRLMRGLPGAANLSLSSGAPVLPIGIQFPLQDPNTPIADGSPMVLEIGNPLAPPAPEEPGKPSRKEIKCFHGRIMEELARISGKTWSPSANKRSRYVVEGSPLHKKS